MSSIIALSRETRHKAQRLCIIQNFWNGLGASFVINDIIALIALFYNANNIQMALIFSALYATFPAALLAPKFLSGIDCSKVWRWMWIFRTALIPAYFFVPLLPEQFQAWAVIIIYFSFCASRSIGTSAAVPVMQVITSENERPSFMGKSIRSFTIAYAIVVLTAYLILKTKAFNSDQNNYHLIIALGLFFSIIACVYLFFLPETGVLQKTSFKDIVRVGKTTIQNWQCRRVIILTMINTLIIILCGYSIPYLKEVIKLNSGNVILLSVIGLAGAIVSTQMLQIIGRRISSWGLLLASHLLIALGALFFTFASPIASEKYMLLFSPAIVLIYFGRQAGIAIILKVQTDAIPKVDRYIFSAIFQLSGVLSSILAILYIKICENWLQQLTIFSGNKYIPIFISCAILCLISCIVILACHGIFRTGADFKMLAPRSLFTFIQMHMLSFRQDRISQMRGYENLMSKNNSLSRSLVIEFLKSNNTFEKNAAIHSLYMKEIDESRPYLLQEALDKESPIRDSAITALGLQNPNNNYIPSLLDLLDDPSGPVRANTVKTLMRYEYEMKVEEFLKLYNSFTDSMQKINSLVGLAATSRFDILKAVIKQEKDSSDKWLSIIFQQFSDMFNRRTEMLELLDAALLSEEQGQKVMKELIEDENYLEWDINNDWLPSNSYLAKCCSKYLLYLIDKHNNQQ